MYGRTFLVVVNASGRIFMNTGVNTSIMGRAIRDPYSVRVTAS